jgi:hypothetical protein
MAREASGGRGATRGALARRGGGRGPARVRPVVVPDEPDKMLASIDGLKDGMVVDGLMLNTQAYGTFVRLYTAEGSYYPIDALMKVTKPDLR